MATITFKSDDQFKKTLETLARHKGINTSAYMKLILTKEMRKELSQLTENGLTVAQELEILDSMAHDKVYGPFETAEEVIKSLHQEDE